MAGKNYKLTLNKSDGTKQDITFTIPQGEKGVTGDKGATGADGDKGPVGNMGEDGASIFAISDNSSSLTSVDRDTITSAGYSKMPLTGDIILNKDGKTYICTEDLVDDAAIRVQPVTRVQPVPMGTKDLTVLLLHLQ